MKSYGTQFVTGFLFNSALNQVVLIKKNKPKWMAGKLNGVGGKIEEGESPIEAMQREFLEEAGATVIFWNPFAVLTNKNNDHTIHYFVSVSSQLMLTDVVETMTPEEIVIRDVRGCTQDSRNSYSGFVMDNMAWLMTMALTFAPPRVVEEKEILHIEGWWKTVIPLTGETA